MAANQLNISDYINYMYPGVECLSGFFIDGIYHYNGSDYVKDSIGTGDISNLQDMTLDYKYVLSEESLYRYAGNNLYEPIWTFPYDYNFSIYVYQNNIITVGWTSAMNDQGNYDYNMTIYGVKDTTEGIFQFSTKTYSFLDSSEDHPYCQFSLQLTKYLCLATQNYSDPSNSVL